MSIINDIFKRAKTSTERKAIQELADELDRTQVWAIQNTQTGLWWSNEWGWGSRDGRELFDGRERRELNLPIGGKWIQLWGAC